MVLFRCCFYCCFDGKSLIVDVVSVISCSVDLFFSSKNVPFFRSSGNRLKSCWKSFHSPMCELDPCELHEFPNGRQINRRNNVTVISNGLVNFAVNNFNTRIHKYIQSAGLFGVFYAMRVRTIILQDEQENKQTNKCNENILCVVDFRHSIKGNICFAICLLCGVRGRMSEKGRVRARVSRLEQKPTKGEFYIKRTMGFT